MEKNHSVGQGKKINLNSLKEIIEKGSTPILENMEESIVVIGNTGAGKSAFINLFLGNKLISVKNESEFEPGFSIDLDPKYPKQDGPKIGHGSISETSVPGLWISNDGKFIIDFPGFQDCKSIEQQIANVYFIKTWLFNCKRVKVLLVIQQTHIDIDRRVGLLNLIKYAMDIFCSNLKTIEIGLVITRVEHKYGKKGLELQRNEEYFKKYLNNIKEEHKNKKTDFFNCPHFFEIYDNMKLILVDAPTEIYENIALDKKSWKTINSLASFPIDSSVNPLSDDLKQKISVTFDEMIKDWRKFETILSDKIGKVLSKKKNPSKKNKIFPLYSIFKNLQNSHNKINSSNQSNKDFEEFMKISNEFLDFLKLRQRDEINKNKYEISNPFNLISLFNFLYKIMGPQNNEQDIFIVIDDFFSRTTKQISKKIKEISESISENISSILENIENILLKMTFGVKHSKSLYSIIMEINDLIKKSFSEFLDGILQFFDRLMQNFPEIESCVYNLLDLFNEAKEINTFRGLDHETFAKPIRRLNIYFKTQLDKINSELAKKEAEEQKKKRKNNKKIWFKELSELQNRFFTCDNDHFPVGHLELKGIELSFEDVMEHIKNAFESNFQFELIVLFATKSISLTSPNNEEFYWRNYEKEVLIDNNSEKLSFSWKGGSLVFVAPTIKIDQKKKLEIDLSGSDGSNGHYGYSGKWDYWGSGGGSNGSNGTDGKHGQHGGNFTLVANFLEKLNNINLNLSGGDGGHGGNGGDGCSCDSNYFTCPDVKDGGNGGDGGNAGRGGKPGRSIIYEKGKVIPNTLISWKMNKGKDGEPGSKGEGGYPYTSGLFTSGGSRGIDGKDGKLKGNNERNDDFDYSCDFRNVCVEYRNFLGAYRDIVDYPEEFENIVGEDPNFEKFLN